MGLVVLTGSLNTGSLNAQTINSAQVPTPPPQDLIPPNPVPFPPTPPLPTLTPPELIPSTPSLPPAEAPEAIPDTIRVREFKFTGSTVFTPQELGAKVNVTSELLYKPLSPSRLLQIASDVANLYAQQGYRTSGAKVVVRQIKPQDKLV